MMSGNEPLECFFNSISVVKVNIRKAAMDLECCWVKQLCKFQICDAKKKGFSMKVHVNEGEIWSTGLKEKEVVNGLIQALPFSFKSGVKRSKKMDGEDELCSCMQLAVLPEEKLNGSKSQFVRPTSEKGDWETEGKHVPLKCMMGFIDQLCQSLPHLDKVVHEDRIDFGQTSPRRPSSSRFSYKKAVAKWLRLDVNDFMRDFRFAKVGGVPSSVVGLSCKSRNEDGDGSATLENKEAEGKRSFKELDRDSNAHATSEDLVSISSETASIAAVPSPDEIPAGSVLRSAIAGGLSCAFSCALMHPVDTIKTQVQASTLSLFEIISMVPQIGARGLYKGSIPAILGQLSGHALRTGIFEASKLVLLQGSPTKLPEIQVNSILSLCSTILGTVTRIPSEVLKQRLQAGLYDSLGEALVGTWRQDGLGGFFRGTGATLCREVPFYVAGMGLYDESKKRELEPWEAVVVGAIAGGLAGVTTTPFDVIKTRMMTTQGQSVSTAVVALSILRQEGPLALYKGAVPRFFWIAPLGAINLAGYELARKALDSLSGKQMSQKKATGSE
ncbi:calcium-binding mitochondrial carrier protein isoform X2 [Arachis ipaensis]|uniref:calcium-binding mitochondrial carrier protein isoform X2 n=1 Tax=Arachis ipaensis TaxID=130454 RepID=UPI000A2B17F2|nr:calcium-binding mitochondrial carrier protein isoform X2 [Arachis ipaensis]